MPEEVKSDEVAPGASESTGVTETPVPTGEVSEEVKDSGETQPVEELKVDPPFEETDKPEENPGPKAPESKYVPSELDEAADEKSKFEELAARIAASNYGVSEVSHIDYVKLNKYGLVDNETKKLNTGHQLVINPSKTYTMTYYDVTAKD